MKINHSEVKNFFRTVMIALTIWCSFSASAVQAASMSATPNARHAKAIHAAGKNTDKGIVSKKQIVKEAADAFKATEAALIALNHDQPEEALAALEVVSGNLHLLLARDPALGLVPIDVRIQVVEGVTDLPTIKKLEDELEDLVDDGRYQAARAIIDSLADEIRVTTVYLPLATYPAAIDAIAPLIDAGKLDEAKRQLIDVLNTYVSEEEVTPLAIVRAEEILTEAFQVEHKPDLSKQETKNKIEELVEDVERHIKVAQTLGYGGKDDYKDLYEGIAALKDAIGTSGFKGEWAKIKKSMAAFKNRIIHPRG